MKHLITPIALAAAFTLSNCNSPAKKAAESTSYPSKPVFNLYDDPNRFADVEILRYDVPGFEKLSLNQKLLVYYLSEAALCGRDMIYDQNNKNNLRLRKTLEELYVNYEGDKKANEFRYFEVYLKRFWMSNGIHHHYAENKLQAEFSSDFLMKMISASPKAQLPVGDSKDTTAFKKWLTDIIFNPAIEAKRVNKADGIDQIKESANNFYDGLTLKEVKAYYDPKKANDTVEPLSWGLNSKLVKENGKLVEKTWKVGGMYGASISKIVEWLTKAMSVAETAEQKAAMQLLIDFYKSGDLKTWDAYNIAWVKDVNSSIDYINGFIEVYHDAIGMRANYESAIEINDAEASKRMAIIAANAQWFEDNSPINKEHKKSKVVGITYKVVNVAMEAGDLAPSTAIGVTYQMQNGSEKNMALNL
ncbi:MAG: dipeptidyl-peptidase 3 family protein [Chitinophagaceae bacterium]